MIAYKLVAMLLIVTGCWYAYRIALRPIDRTWLEVVIGVGFTVVGGIVFISVDIANLVRADWDVPPSLIVAEIVTSIFLSFAATGSPMILGQELKKQLTERHRSVTKGSIRDTREGFTESRNRANQEKAMAEKQGSAEK